MFMTAGKIRQALWAVVVCSFLTPAISLLFSFGWDEFNSRVIGEVDSISSLLLLLLSGSILSGIYSLPCLFTAFTARWIKGIFSLFVMLLISIALFVYDGYAIWGHTDRRAFFYILLYVTSANVVIPLIAFLTLYFIQHRNAST